MIFILLKAHGIWNNNGLSRGVHKVYSGGIMDSIRLNVEVL